MLVGNVGLDCQHGIDLVRAERAGDMCVHGFILVGALCLQMAFFDSIARGHHEVALKQEHA